MLYVKSYTSIFRIFQCISWLYDLIDMIDIIDWLHEMIDYWLNIKFDIQSFINR